MNTDTAWEAWGKQDPYFGVITDPRYRSGNLDEATKQEFFRSGDNHIEYVKLAVRAHLGMELSAERILDFGCGVGRLVIPFASGAVHVVGVDVSPSMLEEAQRNCDARCLKNVTFVLADDELSQVPGTFDMIHSALVFQHIPVARGREIFKRLLTKLDPGGIGMIDFTYGKDELADTFGVPPAPNLTSYLGDTLKGISSLARGADAKDDPEMLMHPYNLSEIFFILQEAGITNVHAQFLDHGGEHAAFLIFRKPA